MDIPMGHKGMIWKLFTKTQSNFHQHLNQFYLTTAENITLLGLLAAVVLTEAPYPNVNIQILRKQWETFLFDVTTNRIIFGIFVLGCLLQVYRNNN